MDVFCPKCESRRIVKNSKRNGVQLFKCKECGMRFSARTGTILEGSQYSDDVWIELVRCMLEGMSVQDAADELRKTVKSGEFDWRTAWSMQHKVMQAAGKVERPMLGGVVEFGLLYLKRTKKGARAAGCTLHEGADERNDRLSGKWADLGVCGPEYDRVAYAVDRAGMCACKAVSGGDLLAGELMQFVRERAGDVEIASSDANGAYRLALKRMGIAHYVKPSRLGKRRGARRRKWLEDEFDVSEYAELQRFGLVERIENVGDMSFEEFLEVKATRGLSLAGADALKSELEQRLVSATTGVSSRYLDRYATWVDYARNMRVEQGERPLGEVASRVFAELSGVVIKEEGRAGAGSTREMSGRYVHQLMEWTEAMREANRDGSFQFKSEDGVECGGVHELVEVAPTGVLERVARDAGVEGARSMGRDELVAAVLPGVSVAPATLLAYLAYRA